MSEPSLVIARDLLERARAQADQYADRVSKLGTTISTWLIVGNAAALAFTAKSLVDGGSCNELLADTGLAFAAGLILNFAGLFVGHLVGLKLFLELANMTDQTQGIWSAEAYIYGLERDGVPVPEDAALKLSIDGYGDAMGIIYHRVNKWAYWGAGVAVALTIAGTISFSVGLIRPFLDQAALAQCKPGLVRVAQPSPANGLIPVKKKLE